MFTVTWRNSALEKLAQIWMSAEDRESITTAADEIDETLRRLGNQAGESREGSRRFFFNAPLAVYFEAFAEDMRVEVTAVWRR